MRRLKYEVEWDGKGENVFVRAKLPTGETLSRICLSGIWTGIDEEKEIARMKREIRKEAAEKGFSA